ncbi:MAG: hypothetical protein Q3971_09815 [Moraxella sp.]|nr:hypothetical protein [Moraxella sp.]
MDYQKQVSQPRTSVLKGKGRGDFHGIVPTHPSNPIYQTLQKLAKLNPFKTNLNNLEPWQYMVEKQDIDELQTLLKQSGGDELAKLLNDLNKKLKKIS